MRGPLRGTLNGPSSHLTVTPNYTSCKFSAFNAVVDMNGCTYTFETPAKKAVDVYTAPVQIVCPAGKSITITVPGGGSTCDITVHAQTPGGGVAITNDTAAGDLAVKANVTNIGYTIVVDGFGCPFNGTGAKTGASYIQHGPITFDAVSPAAASIQVSG